MRQPVKAEPSDAVTRRDIGGDCVPPGALGKPGMKGGVEDGNHRHLGPQLVAARPYGGHGRWVVKRGQPGKGIQLFDDLVVDERRLYEQPPTVNDPVSHR